jgi:hypothetical protein
MFMNYFVLHYSIQFNSIHVYIYIYIYIYIYNHRREERNKDVLEEGQRNVTEPQQ